MTTEQSVCHVIRSNRRSRRRCSSFQAILSFPVSHLSIHVAFSRWDCIMFYIPMNMDVYQWIWTYTNDNWCTYTNANWCTYTNEYWCRYINVQWCIPMTIDVPIPMNIDVYQSTVMYSWWCMWLMLLVFLLQFILYFFLFLKMGHPRPLFHLFLVFFKQTSIQFLQQKYVKKYPSSIQHQDSNPQPLEQESSPITTRPELPSFI